MRSLTREKAGLVVVVVTPSFDEQAQPISCYWAHHEEQAVCLTQEVESNSIQSLVLHFIDPATTN